MEDVGALADTLEPGAIFAEDYRVVRPLAAGGMGAVYVVDQLSTGKARALKVMRPELADDEDARRRFQQEARLGAKIESEHVVEIQSAGVDESTKAPFIVMELLVGEDLSARLERGSLDPGATLALFEQLCHAVAAAHDAGIVHRDLKPENIFLAEAKRAGSAKSVDVKVLDFGIAKLVAESATRGKTTTGMIGTPLWMAPEQTEPGRLTPSADVWALGLILYNVLTGAHYWRSAADDTSTYAQILKEVCMGPMPAATVRAREQGVADRWPAELDVVFARSVVRDPTKRYRDARLFMNAVREVLSRHAPGVPSSGRLIASTPSSARIQVGAASPHEKTEFAPPIPAAAPLANPPVMPPRPAIPQEPPLLDAKFGGLSDIAGIPVRVLLVLVAVLLMGGVVLVISTARRSAVERQVERERETTNPMILAPGAQANPAGHSNVNAANPPCPTKLCSGDVTTALGPLDKARVVASVERSFNIIEAQCLRKPHFYAGSATYGFTIREGKAILRRLISSSNPTRKDGIDDCITGALGEVAFPAYDEGTDVTYTLRWSPR